MIKSDIDILWVIVSASLVFMMQGGFLCLEAGLTRPKNAINVAIKNLADLGVSVCLYWLCGFALMFGITKGGWFGSTLFFSPLDQSPPWLSAFFLFNVMFCATASTIVSGALAERIRFSAYIIITIIVSGLIYPIYGHWAWGGALQGPVGWLAELGFVDFAGATVVHSVGGWVALAALLIIGARAERFSPDGKPRALPASDLTITMLGVILLFVGWMGFNGGSTYALNGQVPGIIVNTILGGAAGMVMTLAIGWRLEGYVSPISSMNGVLAGLVSLTATAHAVSSLSAIVIGAIGGVIMLAVNALLEKCSIDDAVGAVPVHLGAGIWGTMALAIFGKLDVLNTGLSRGEQFLAQGLGVGVCFIFVFSASYVIFFLINRLSPLRISSDDEHIGLNVSEHGAKDELLDIISIMETQTKTGNLSLRVPENPFSELGMIARNYNLMLASFEKLYARNHLTLNALGEGIYGVDLEGKTTFINPAAAKMTGWGTEEMIGKAQHELLHHTHANGEHYPRNECPIYASFKDGKTYRIENEVFWRKDGTSFPVAYTSTPIKESGKLQGAVVVFKDISERKMAEEALAKQAIRDPLTGLYNRRFFDSRINEEMSRAKRNKRIIAFLLCDLDGFKAINDTHGHQTGDLILKEVSEVMKSSVRDVDLVFRWGGDEMVILLLDTSRDGSLDVANRVRQEVIQVGINANINSELDVSTGISLYPEHGTKPEALIKLADRAMYIAKKGGGKINIGEEEYSLDPDSIKAVFQPVMDLRFNQALGYEALTRDSLGSKSVLELFENYEAIGKLNEFKCLCFNTQMRAAQESNLERLFINVDFKLLKKIDIPPLPHGMEIILEISEGEALLDIDDHLRVANLWKNKGYKFAIDDFGAGFISLPFIAKLLPEYIKLDRSTVLQAVASVHFREILSDLIIALHRCSTDGIIAEGIETEKELSIMKNMGINLIQGYLFGQPEELSVDDNKSVIEENFKLLPNLSKEVRPAHYP